MRKFIIASASAIALSFAAVPALAQHGGGGHSGSSGRYDALREVAWDMAWLLHTLKVEG